MTILRTFTLILCVTMLLLVCAVSAGGPESAAADGSTTLRASTSAGGSPLAQVEGVPDAPSGVGQPSWVGPIVLIFGGLLGGLWLVVGVLSVLRVLGDARPRVDTPELPPFSNRTRNEEAPPADWL